MQSVKNFWFRLVLVTFFCAPIMHCLPMGGFGNISENRSQFSLLAPEFSCPSAPIARCPQGQGEQLRFRECTGWESGWIATCPDDGKMYACHFVAQTTSLTSKTACKFTSQIPPAAVSMMTSGMTISEIKAKAASLESQSQKKQEPTPSPGYGYGAAVLPTTEFAFRKAKWGMAYNQVKQSEPQSPFEESPDKTSLVYSVDVSGLSTRLIYLFKNNQLVRGGFLFNIQHTNKSDYINDFNTIKKVLEAKYGAPKNDNIIWKNDLYKSDAQNRGTAIGIGHLIFQAIWETDSTIIHLVLKGDNYKISFSALYLSKQFQQMIEDENMKKSLDSF